MAETVVMFGTGLLRAFDDAVMPLCCAFCGVRTRREERCVCDGCAADLPWVEPRVATAPFRAELAPLAYDFPIDAAIKALKFGRRLWYGPALAQLLGSVLDSLPDDLDAVLPVPLHWRRKWWRGFNQAREIARPVARQLGLPLVGGVRRARPTRAQSGLTATARRQNLRGAFVASHANDWRHVLIVDDVITTGATVRELARTVSRAGAEKVSVLAVARA